MYINAERMACGNCGENHFAVYKVPEGNAFILVVECLNCGSDSVVSVSAPKIKIDFGENSDGRLCVM